LDQLLSEKIFLLSKEKKEKKNENENEMKEEKNRSMEKRSLSTTGRHVSIHNGKSAGNFK
jgi:hypothetical protein